MSDLRPKSIKIKLGGVEYGLRFSLNAIDEIQDHFDKSILDLGDIMKDERKHFKNTAYILSVLINEEIDFQNETLSEKLPHIDEVFIGRRITLSNYRTATGKVFESFGASASEDESDPQTGE